jgi:hypothetical protein
MGTGSDMPVPRLSNVMTRANDARRLRKRACQESSHMTSTIAVPGGDEDDVEGAAAEYLVADVGLADSREEGFGLHGGHFLPVGPISSTFG